jgi:hypothetical protein
MDLKLPDNDTHGTAHIVVSEVSHSVGFGSAKSMKRSTGFGVWLRKDDIEQARALIFCCQRVSHGVTTIRRSNQTRKISRMPSGHEQ